MVPSFRSSASGEERFCMGAESESGRAENQPYRFLALPQAEKPHHVRLGVLWADSPSAVTCRTTASHS